LKDKAGLVTGSGYRIGPSATLLLAEAEAAQWFFKIFEHFQTNSCRREVYMP